MCTAQARCHVEKMTRDRVVFRNFGVESAFVSLRLLRGDAA
jgi:hypothetical protein